MILEHCAICGASESRLVLEHPDAMVSDGREIPLPITKAACVECGAVRTYDIGFLGEELYRREYRLNVSDHDPIYVYRNETVRRSRLHYEWITSLCGEQLAGKKSILEIGCGSGLLIGEFELPEKYGIEPSRESCEHAGQRCEATNCSFEEFRIERSYDVLLSCCVLEHVADPGSFLEKARRMIADDGIMILGVPIQDNTSYDVFFIDHLHHFYYDHLVRLLERHGFDVLTHQIGYKCENSIAYLIAQKSEKKFRDIPYIENTNFEFFQGILERFNRFLADHRERKMVAFGNGEYSMFFQIYSDVAHYVRCYIDDKKNRPDVVTVGEALANGVLDGGLLLMLNNPEYNLFLKKRFEEVGDLDMYSPITGDYVR